MTSLKITPKLAPLIIAKANEGMKSYDIAEWLLTDHGVQLSARAVRRFLRVRREEAADVAKSVVREELRKHVLPCIGKTLDLIDRARAVERRARKNKDAALELKAQDRQRRAIEMVLHHAGLNEPDQVAPPVADGQNPRQVLLRRFDLLMQSAAVGGDSNTLMKN